MVPQVRVYGASQKALCQNRPVIESRGRPARLRFGGLISTVNMLLDLIFIKLIEPFVQLFRQRR